MTLSWEQIRDLYRKRAGRYDLTANLYYLIGFRERHYRKRAVAALDLQKGDTVVELGCGTGLNFSYLQSMVGPEGKIVGVDLTDAMLARAAQRVDRHGWRNVELVQADAGSFAVHRSSPVERSTLASVWLASRVTPVARSCKSSRVDPV